MLEQIPISDQRHPEKSPTEGTTEKQHNCCLFVRPGAIGLLWFVLWSVFVFNSPSTHPRISEEERRYITSSLKNEVTTSSAHHSVGVRASDWAVLTHVCPPSSWFPAVHHSGGHPLAGHCDVQSPVGHRGGPLLLQLDLLHAAHAAAHLHERHPGLQYSAGGCNDPHASSSHLFM